MINCVRELPFCVMLHRRTEVCILHLRKVKSLCRALLRGISISNLFSSLFIYLVCFFSSFLFLLLLLLHLCFNSLATICGELSRWDNEHIKYLQKCPCARAHINKSWLITVEGRHNNCEYDIVNLIWFEQISERNHRFELNAIGHSSTAETHNKMFTLHFHAHFR